jgi:hypothetical protein
MKIKIQVDNLVVAEANKNKTVVILNKHSYYDKVYTIIWTSKFDVINSNPVIAYHKGLKCTLRMLKPLMCKEQL